MAKKKRRFYHKRKKKQHCQARHECLFKDNHHILYTKKHWGSGFLDVLRKYPYCKALIPKCTLHRLIHHDLPEIPAPPPYVAKDVLTQIKMLENLGVLTENDTIEQKLKILMSLFDTVAQPTSDALRKQLDIVREYYARPSK